jgi:hypothetical protein
VPLTSALRAHRALLGAAAGVILLTGCVSQTFPTGHAPAQPIAKARTLRTAPEPVRAFPDPATCGEFELGQGERLPASAVRCIRETGQGAASLVFAMPTTEGDPIVTFVLHRRGTRSLVLWTTSDFDRYGAAGWERDTCRVSVHLRHEICAR